MGSRYHYDKHGNYRGKTTDEPPSDPNGCLVVAVVLFFLFYLSGGC